MRRVVALLAFLFTIGCAGSLQTPKEKAPPTQAELVGRTVQLRKVCVDEDGLSAASASGVFLDGDTIVTAKHVTRGGASCVLTFERGGEMYYALDIKEHPEADIATFEVGFDFGYEPLVLANPTLGEQVLVVGYPYDLYSRTTQLSLTRGTLVTEYATAFRMTAQVLPGSSGGPVYSQSGELLGVVSSYLALRGTRVAYDGHYYVAPVRFLLDL